MNLPSNTTFSVILISSFSFSWQLQARGNIVNPESVPPPDGGTIVIHPEIVEETNWVPPLVGRDPSDPKTIREFLANGFKVEVVGYQKSKTIKKGSVIWQKPKPYAEVVWTQTRKDGLIKVILSSGE